MIRTDEVAHLAEQATLGGLLLAPQHFGEVNAWVRGQDFADPWHRQVWVTLRELHTAGTPVSPQGLARALVERVGARLAEIVRIHDLLAVVPKDPDPRPPARTVVDFGVRRDIAAQGVLLEAAALSAAVHLEARPFRASVRIVGAAYLIAGERWLDAHGSPPDAGTGQFPIQMRAAASDLELRRAADKYLSQSPALDPAQAKANEKRLVACLASHPTAITPTQGWLPAERLTNRPWRTVYLALGELADTGHSVDSVSLATTVLRLSRQTGTAPDLGEILAAVGDETPSLPGHLRQLVAADQLRLLAHTGARALREGAANPTTRMPDLLGTAGDLVQDLSALSTALPDVIGRRNSTTLSIVRNRGVDLNQPAADRHDGPVAG
ncbi:MAG: DnaB-like helicase N-terminal domain-containing protein [Cellulomonas sp.]